MAEHVRYPDAWANDLSRHQEWLARHRQMYGLANALYRDGPGSGVIHPRFVADAIYIPQMEAESALWHYALKLPITYDMNVTEIAAVRNVTAGLGLGPRSPEDALLFPFFHGNRDRDTMSPVEEEIATLLTETNEACIPRDDGYQRMTRFLGCETQKAFEETLTARLIEQCEALAQMTDLPKEDIKTISRNLMNALTFTRHAYNLTDSPGRRSGESYYCHPMRSLWYALGYLRMNRMGFQSVAELLDFVETVLFHDILEDLNPSRDKRKRNTSAYFKDDSSRDESQRTAKNSLQELVTVSEDGTTQSYFLRNPTRKAIEILTAHDEERYMQTSLVTPYSSLVKMFDRLDNLLTLPQKSLSKFLIKLIESFGPSTHMVLRGRGKVDPVHQTIEIWRHINHDLMPQLMPLTVLTYDLFVKTLSQVQSIRDQEDPPSRDFDAWYGDQAVLMSDIGGLFPMTGLTDAFAARQAEDTTALFGINDLVTYLRRLYELCGKHRPVTLGRRVGWKR